MIKVKMEMDTLGLTDMMFEMRELAKLCADFAIELELNYKIREESD